MATRSMIFLQGSRDKNKFRYIYSHWDGYPEWNGRVLKYFYLPHPEKVEKLISLGDVSSIETKIDDCIFYNRDYGEPWDQVAPKEGIFRDVLSMVQEGHRWGVDYIYIIYRDGNGGFELKCYAVPFHMPTSVSRPISIPPLHNDEPLPFDDDGNPIGDHAAYLAQRKQEIAKRRSSFRQKNKDKEEE